MRALGMILAGGSNHRMRELANERAIAAMPVAGSYRGIDFALSNMSILKVLILPVQEHRIAFHFFELSSVSFINVL